MRGIAAVVVVVFHVITGSLSPIDPRIFKWAAHGVDIFFVISGFIMFTAARNESFVRFWVARLLRIYPLYWLALLTLVVVNHFATDYGLSGRELLASVILWPRYSTGFPDQIWPLLIPGWALTYELLFYVIFSIGIVTRRVVAVPVAIMALLIVAGAVIRPQAAPLVVATNPLLAEFIIGLFMGVLFRRDMLRLGPVLIVWIVTASTCWATGGGTPLVIANAGGIVATVILLEPVIARWRSKTLTILGDASYSIYLFHTLVLGVPGILAPTLIAQHGTAGRWTVAVVTTLLAIGTGILVHFAIARPLLKRLAPLTGAVTARMAGRAGTEPPHGRPLRDAGAAPSDGRPSILFVSRLPPDADGPGGTQRAMQLLRALAAQGTVDLVLLYRKSDVEAVAAMTAAAAGAAPLGPDATALVRGFAGIEIEEWAAAEATGSKFLWQARQIGELLRTHAPDAPRFSRRTIDRIAAALPARRYDTVFAGRLSSACIVDQLIDNDALKATTRIVDLDDLVSRFRERELAVAGPSEGRLRRTLHRIVIRRVRAAEFAVCREWDVVGLPVAKELDWLREQVPAARLQFLPNVIERPLLPPSRGDGIRILFVGHLAYTPNVDGLRIFLEEAWPIVRTVLPAAHLDVVGMYPGAAVVEMVATAGAELHANVPSVEPYYQACDVVVSPIRYASGTRIKIIEAMAFARAVVSTAIGAEGLAVEAGRHALIADTMPDFARAVVALCSDPTLRARIAAEGRQLQQRCYSPAALATAVADAMAPAPVHAPSHESPHHGQ